MPGKRRSVNMTKRPTTAQTNFLLFMTLNALSIYDSDLYTLSRNHLIALFEYKYLIDKIALDRDQCADNKL